MYVLHRVKHSSGQKDVIRAYTYRVRTEQTLRTLNHALLGKLFGNKHNVTVFITVMATA